MLRAVALEARIEEVLAAVKFRPCVDRCEGWHDKPRDWRNEGTVKGGKRTGSPPDWD